MFILLLCRTFTASAPKPPVAGCMGTLPSRRRGASMVVSSCSSVVSSCISSTLLAPQNRSSMSLSSSVRWPSDEASSSLSALLSLCCYYGRHYGGGCNEGRENQPKNHDYKYVFIPQLYTVMFYYYCSCCCCSCLLLTAPLLRLRDAAFVAISVAGAAAPSITFGKSMQTSSENLSPSVSQWEKLTRNPLSETFRRCSSTCETVNDTGN